MQVQNSELQKALWEDFSLHRIIAMPVVMALLAGWLTLAEGPERASNTIQNMAYISFYIIGILWGTYQSAHAIPKEVSHNTWDNLRLSPVLAGELVLGKLFGSTLYQWYGALILLGFYFFTSLNSHPVLETAFTTLCMLGLALLCQSIAMLGTMLPLRKQNKIKRLPAFGGFVGSLLVSASFYGQISNLFYKPHSEIFWFGLQIPTSIFLSTSLAISLFWVFCALYRIMREALQFKNLPTMWTSFVIFLMLYSAGFMPEGNLSTRANYIHWPNYSNLLAAFFIGVGLTYLNFFTDNLSFTKYRSFMNVLHQKNWHQLFCTMPLWMISISLGSIAGITFAGLSLLSFEPKPIYLVLSLLLFVLRDSGIFHYFALKPKGRLPHFAALFYLFLLYWLIPTLGSVLGFKQFSYAFLPSMNLSLESIMISSLSISVQLVVVIFLVKNRYQQLVKETDLSA